MMDKSNNPKPSITISNAIRLISVGENIGKFRSEIERARLAPHHAAATSWLDSAKRSLRRAAHELDLVVFEAEEDR